MLSTKIRSTIIATVAVAGMSLPGSASAMAVAHTAGTLTKPVAVVQTHVTADQTGGSKEAGSAGVPGYDDDTCQGLANDYDTAVNYLEGAILEGNDKGVDTYGGLANQIYTQLTSNCLVVD